MQINKICIVGYGLHVKKTIIPSLNIQTKNIKIITKKIIDEFETFSSIHVALKELSKDYIFFNSTPPKFHYLISKLILSSGFNVIVEKPSCLKVNQLEKLNNIARKKKLFIFSYTFKNDPF
jgi:predicted dehydrogenase